MRWTAEIHNGCYYREIPLDGTLAEAEKKLYDFIDNKLLPVFKKASENKA